MNLDEVVKELQKYNEILNTQKIGMMTGDDVSKLVLKLAGYNSTLGEYVADAERAADYAEASFDLKKEQKYKEARTELKFIDPVSGNEKAYTADDSDNYKRLESMDEKGAWIEAKYQARVLLLLHNDTRELIGAARSRLSYLKAEKENTNVQV